MQRSGLCPWPHGWPLGPGKAQADRSARVPGGLAAGLSTRGFVFGAL